MTVRQANIAQCVGLWLAEGSSNSISEITFTNNQSNLIRHFHSILSKTLKFKNKPRIYAYSQSEINHQNLPVKNVIYRFYSDKRANRPYFIYRIAGRELVKNWLNIVKQVVTTKKLYANILQGFFAGEGNIKFIEKSKSRVLRIAQGKKNKFIERLLNYFKIRYSYSDSERAYIISGRENLDKLAKINISYLHSEKHEKFVHMIDTYKQYHYPRGQLKKLLLKTISKEPKTSKELSKVFNRDHSRITRVLVNLKKNGKVIDYRVRSSNYWTSDKNIIIISDIKKKILGLLRKPKKTSEISKFMNVNPKSSFRRLKELERLNLVKYSNDLWYKLPTKKEVIVYNISSRYR